MKHVALLAVLALLILAVAALPLVAFDVSWHSVDGGGGTSAGGKFTLTGSVGQPDAGAMSGGQFTLSGGFWPGTAPGWERWLPVVMR